MRTLRICSYLAAAAFAAVAFAPQAYAFHDGGVAYCDGCHTMHNSSGNAAMAVHPGGGTATNGQPGVKGTGTSTQFQGKAYLLQGSDDSSTCLNCHADATGVGHGFVVMTYPAPTQASGLAVLGRSPGGDFGWLTQSFPAAGYSASSPGQRHGHNVIAADFGLIADPDLATSPGGSYPAAGLSCASCHDPHSRARIIDAAGTIATATLGQKTLPIGGSGSYGAAPTATDAVGVYRLLGSATYSQMSVTAPAFTANPPVAVAPSTYNRSESVSDTRVAYGAGMSEWCANCHSAIHNGNVNGANTALIHPAGNTALLTAKANNLAGSALGTTIATIYNDYKSSGDLSGTVATSYTSLVPYEEGTTTIATLAALAGAGTGPTTGPGTGTENVMCLSCHRAHATGFNAMTRWNNNGEFLTVAGAWPDFGGTGSVKSYSNGMSLAQYTAGMNDHPATRLAVDQRSLCNKCHAKD
jgi:hypothetical protein